MSENAQVYRQKVTEIDPFVASWNLGAGESEVITLAVDKPGYGVVLDDLQARNCAQILSIPLIGSLGLLVRAKKEGLLEIVKPAFDRLVASGMYIDPELAKSVLTSIGEQSE